MKNYLLAFCIFFLLVTCSKKTHKESNEGTFDNYVKSLNQIPLPLSHSSLVESFPDISKCYDTLGFEKYKHVWTSKPLGKLYETDSSVVLVDLSYGDFGQVPFITSYDKKGNKIDSLGPYKKAGADMGYDAVEYLTISENRSIVVIDTVKRWKLNSDESDIIPDSLTITIDTSYYKITNSGNIVKIK